MKLALVRAAAPQFGDRLVGSAQVPLSPEGQERARAAAGLIAARGDVSRVYAPAQGHAAEAAALVSQGVKSAPVTARDDFAELHFGLWQGLLEPELVRRHKTAFRAFLTDARAVVAPEGEEVDKALERVGRALAKIRRRHARDPLQVVVVAPEFAFTLLVAAALGREAPPDLWRERSEGADVRFFEIG